MELSINRELPYIYHINQGSHNSRKIIEVQICFKILEKLLNFMKSSWYLFKGGNHEKIIEFGISPSRKIIELWNKHSIKQICRYEYT